MIYLTDLVLITLLVSWLIKHFRFERSDIYKYVFGLVLIIFIGLFHVKRLDLGLFTALKWIELLLLMFFIRHEARSISFVRISMMVIFVSALLQAGIAISQFHVQHPIGLGGTGEYFANAVTPGVSTIDIGGEKIIRAYGTFPHPNVLAAFLIFGLNMGLYFISHETNKWSLNKMIVSCGTAIILFGLFVTFSRISWLAAGLSMGLFILWHLRTKSYPIAGLIVLIGIVSCGTIGLFYKNLLTNRVSELDSQSNSIVLRESFNGMGSELFQTNPVLGVGVGNYIPAMLNNYELEPWQYQPAHNIFIFTAVELGFLGAILFGLIILEAIRSTWNTRVTLVGFTLLVMMLVFLVMGQFDHYFVTIQQGRLMFFTLIGLMLAIPYSQQTNDSQNETIR